MEKQQDKTYKKTYKEMENYFLNDSNGMTLYNILEQIIKYHNNDFIFSFIKYKNIQEIIGCIKGLFKINRDEAIDISICIIIEYFLGNENNLNLILDNFNEICFLDNFKRFIRNNVKKEMRKCYSIKEIPVSCIDIEDKSIDVESFVINKLDIGNLLNKLSARNKEIVKLYFFNKVKQKELAQEFNISRNRISEIINESKNILKKYYKMEGE